VEVEQLEDVAEVDQEAGRLTRIVPERLAADPVAAFLADGYRVVDLGLLALVPRHERIIGTRLERPSNRLLLGRALRRTACGGPRKASLQQTVTWG
jgi:hypothetical protein